MTTKQLFQFWGLAVVVIGAFTCMSVGRHGWIIPIGIGVTALGSTVATSLFMHLINFSRSDLASRPRPDVAEVGDDTKEQLGAMRTAPQEDIMTPKTLVRIGTVMQSAGSQAESGFREPK